MQEVGLVHLPAGVGGHRELADLRSIVAVFGRFQHQTGLGRGLDDPQLVRDLAQHSPAVLPSLLPLLLFVAVCHPDRSGTPFSALPDARPFEWKIREGDRLHRLEPFRIFENRASAGKWSLPALLDRS